MDMDFRSAAPSRKIRDYCFSIAEKFPSVSLFTIGCSLSGQPIDCMSIGAGEICHIVVGAHHASEHITALICVKFVCDLAKAVRDGMFLAGFDAKQIFSRRKIFVVPVINPDGTDIQQGVFPCGHILFPRLVSMNPSGRDFTHWQANARGVDLNHNYDAGFADCRLLERNAGIYSGGPSRFCGQYPESEPETHALCNLTRFLAPQLKTAVALHTQGEEIYYDYLGDCPRGSLMLAECFSRVSGYTVSKPSGIASYGGYKDWVISKLGIPAFTIERGKGENPLPPSDFDNIYKKVLPILLTAAAFG